MPLSFALNRMGAPQLPVVKLDWMAPSPGNTSQLARLRAGDIEARLAASMRHLQSALDGRP